MAIWIGASQFVAMDIGASQDSETDYSVTINNDEPIADTLTSELPVVVVISNNEGISDTITFGQSAILVISDAEGITDGIENRKLVYYDANLK